MTDETEIDKSDPKVSRAERAPVKAELSHNEGVRTDRSTDRWSVRSVELKRQKRHAHRRRINAANRPG
jgi:hypothetical protein